MLTKKSLLLMIVACGLFQTVFSSPEFFASVKNAFRHFRCGIHEIINEIVSHQHKRHDPCEFHHNREAGITISDGSPLRDSGTVDTHTEKHIIKIDNPIGSKPRTSGGGSKAEGDNNSTTTSKPKATNEVGNNPH